MTTALMLHVAEDGCDGWSGARPNPNEAGTDGPLATIGQARDRIRAIRQAGKLRAPVEVLVHAGRYSFTETLQFDEEDLGDERTPVTYRAAGDGEVILAGGIRLDKYDMEDNGVARFSLAEAGHAGLRFRQLICNGVRQPMARYPNYDPERPYTGGYLHVEGPAVDINEDGHGRKDRFVCRDPRLKDWSRIDEVELFVFPRTNYCNDIVRLQSYDPATGEVTLAEPTSYEIYPGDRFYFRNVREELDAPGEWYLDKRAEVLYLHPPVPLEDAVVTVPLVENLIEVNGRPKPAEDFSLEKIDWTDTGGEIRLAQNPEGIERGFLTFQGFTVEGCNGAGIVFRGVRSCGVRECAIRNIGNVGVVVLGGIDCTVADCDIRDTGNHGVYASGGVRSPFKGKFACRHDIRNNYVHHTGVFTKNSAGIAINGVGIAVAHNEVHDSPRWGILSRGSDNLIEYNRIHHVNLETSDTAAIYLVDRDLAMNGTRIRYNRIHDVLGYAEPRWRSHGLTYGIYLDDYTSGVEVRGNLTYRTLGGGAYIHAGQDNVVENNMFLETDAELAHFRRWEPEREYRTLGTHGLALRRNSFCHNILASRRAAAKMYLFSNCATEEHVPDVDGNVFAHNIVWLYGSEILVEVERRDGGRSSLSLADWQALGWDEGTLAVDPQIADLDAEDFRLAETSPALAAGFAPLPLERMGLDRTVRLPERRREQP